MRSSDELRYLMTFAATDSNSWYKTSYELVKDGKCLCDVILSLTGCNYRYIPMHGQSINQQIFVHYNSVQRYKE